MDGPRTEKYGPSKSMWCSLARSTKRPVAVSRISASSSQLSQSREAASAASAASAQSVSAGAVPWRPKALASASVSETPTSQPARPSLTQSRVLTAIEVWKGSVWVVVTVGTRPRPWVTGASRAKVASASSRRGSGCRSRRG